MLSCLALVANLLAKNGDFPVVTEQKSAGGDHAENFFFDRLFGVSVADNLPELGSFFLDRFDQFRRIEGLAATLKNRQNRFTHKFQSCGVVYASVIIAIPLCAADIVFIVNRLKIVALRQFGAAFAAPFRIQAGCVVVSAGKNIVTARANRPSSAGLLAVGKPERTFIC